MVYQKYLSNIDLGIETLNGKILLWITVLTQNLILNFAQNNAGGIRTAILENQIIILSHDSM